MGRSIANGGLLAAVALLGLASANPPTTPDGAAAALKQYTSGGHVLGFESGGYYISNGTYALRVNFERAAAVALAADEGAGAETSDGKAGPLRRVTYPDLWPGISVTYDAPGSAIARSTWTLAPGADPAAIRLRYNRAIKLTEAGKLGIAFDTGTLAESRPVAWQDVDGQRQPVEVAFVLLDEDAVGFRVGSHRTDLPLMIDPTVTWNTFLGSSGFDEGDAIAVDASGNVYVTGYSGATWGSPVRAYTSPGADAFAAKLTSAGALIWNTFLGGSASDVGRGIAVDGSGNVYVVGQSEAAWGSPVRAYAASVDAFAAQLTSAGALTWNTFLGSSGGDFGNGIAVDGSGNVYVAGASDATWGSPVRTHTASNDAFAAQLTSAGTLTWNTFLGGSGSDVGRGIAADGSGNVYVVGHSPSTWGSPVRAYTASSDAFAAKLTSAGALTWNTFLGGGGNDTGFAIAVDGSGNVYVVGASTATWDSPVRTYTSDDAFAAKLTSAGALAWNTFLGGSGSDTGFAVAVDGSGSVYVVGESPSTWGSPVTPYTAGSDASAAKLTPAGVLTWNTFLGGSGGDVGLGIAADGSGNVYVAGYSNATWGSPVAAYTASLDVFVAQMPVDAPPTATPTSTPTVTPTPPCGNSNIDAGEQCDDGNTVNGDCCSATCQYEANGSPCASDGNPCTLDQCNGAGACAHPAGNAGALCRTSAGSCDVAELCTGAGTTCPTDGFEPSSTVCRSASGQCDIAEHCSGVSATCPVDGYVSSGTACSSDGSVCTTDQCNGSGVCAHIDNGSCENTSTNVSPGGTITTDPEADGATPSDPVETSITSPTGGTISIEERPTASSPSAFFLYARETQITAPPATAGSPLVIAFRLDASILLPQPFSQAHIDVGYPVIIKDGNIVVNCTGPSGVASPDPCVASRVLQGDGDVIVTVRTSTASIWQFAIPSGSCPDTVDNGCVGGFAKALLLVKDSVPGKEKLVAKLGAGPTLAQTDLGNPLSGADGGTGTVVSLCIYADTGDLAGELIAAGPTSTCAAGAPCWKSLGNGPNDPGGPGKGYSYKDGDAETDGLQKLLYKGGEAGKPKVIVKAKGSNLPPGIPAALQISAEVTIQLRSSDGECLTATISDIQKQDAESFKAK